jgi:hypothetical protein
VNDKEEDAFLDFLQSEDGQEARERFLRSLGTTKEEVEERVGRVMEGDLNEIRKKTTAIRLGGSEPDMDAVVYGHVWPPTVVLTVALPVPIAQSLIASWMIYQSNDDEEAVEAATELDAAMGQMIEALMSARPV